MTETNKFTPGPWAVTGYARKVGVVANDLLICEVEGGGASNPKVLEQARANARLIAAAPDLYDAACVVLGILENGDPRDAPIYLQQAIALVGQPQNAEVSK